MGSMRASGSGPPSPDMKTIAMRKGFLATLALLALVQAEGTPPAALPALAGQALPAAPTLLSAAPPAAIPGGALPAPPLATPAQPTPGPGFLRARWPAALAPTPLEVPLRALAPARAGELPLLGMR